MRERSFNKSKTPWGLIAVISILLLILIGVCLIGGLLLHQSHDNNITNLDDNITNLEYSITNLEDNINNLENNISNHKDKTTQLQFKKRERYFCINQNKRERSKKGRRK
jgi:peptidoglycan hydrolase CwlO-like protein